MQGRELRAHIFGNLGPVVPVEPDLQPVVYEDSEVVPAGEADAEAFGEQTDFFGDDPEVSQDIPRLLVPCLVEAVQEESHPARLAGACDGPEEQLANIVKAKRLASHGVLCEGVPESIVADRRQPREQLVQQSPVHAGTRALEFPPASVKEEMKVEMGLSIFGFQVRQYSLQHRRLAATRYSSDAEHP